MIEDIEDELLTLYAEHAEQMQKFNDLTQFLWNQGEVLQQQPYVPSEENVQREFDQKQREFKEARGILLL